MKYDTVHLNSVISMSLYTLYDIKYSETDIGHEVDYVKLAEAYHIKGYRVCNMTDFKTAIDVAAKNREPILIECELNKNSCVYPIVPPGKSIDKLVTE